MGIKHLTYAAIPLIAASMTSQAATVDQLNRQVQKLNQRIAEQDQRFRVNGFATFGMSVADEEVAYKGGYHALNCGRFSKIGVQMTFNIDSQNSVVTQLVSRGENSWETQAEWAYFKHDFNNGLTAKVGRIRLPAFMLSEFLDVGYAVPWAKMPNESYSTLTPFANMEGFDLSYNTDIGDLSATVQFAYGRSTTEDFDLKGIMSLNGALQADTWNAKVSYSTSEIDITSESFTQAFALYGSKDNGLGGSFTSLGFTYDPGNIYFSTEYTSLEVDGLIVDEDSAHATIGYRFGAFMPTLTYGMVESQDDDERDLAVILANNPAVSGTTTIGDLVGLAAFAGVGNGTLTEANLQTVAAGADIYSVGAVVQAGAAVTADEIVNQGLVDSAQAAATGVIGAAQTLAGQNIDTTRIGLGLRYDVSPGTALKFQYDIIEANDSAGLFDTESYNAASTKPDTTNILTISLDTVF